MKPVRGDLGISYNILDMVDEINDRTKEIEELLKYFLTYFQDADEDYEDRWSQIERYILRLLRDNDV